MTVPPDSFLITAAQEAGLCLPRCWNLDEIDSPEILRENREWVEAAATPQQRQDRQAILNGATARAREQLANLRRFAELIIARSAQS